MGLLDALKQYVMDAMPGGLLNPEIEQGANDVANGIRARGKAFERGLLDPNTYAKDALHAGLDLAGMAPIGMTVWHGSPHKFTKFDMSKIGTGEGAQAYGHGLYMAETPDVAKSYINAQRDQSAGSIAEKYLKNWGDKDKAIAALEKQVAKAKEEFKPEYVAPYIDALGMLKKGQSDFGGALYKVDIPDEAVARMLDWDKPLSQQAPEVQAALANTKNKQLRAMVDYANVPYSEAIGGETKTMGEAFRLLNLNLQGKSAADSAKASALLAKQGIPGIRYLDGGSRSAGQGSSNFVLFDDQMPRILEINGTPTGNQAWKPGEWQGLLK